MSVLGRKARRDIARHRWQYISIGITIMLGLTLFAGSYDAYLNLEASYRHTYDRLDFADLTITGGDTATMASQASATDGVAAVTVRRESDVAIRVDGDHVLLGRVVELPDSGQPAVDKVDALAGALPAAGDGSLAVERHMVDHFGLAPGDDLELLTGTSWESYPVAASVASPEYIWPARSRQDVLTSPDDFGVVFARPSVFDAVATSPVTEVLVTYRADADPAAVTAALTATARDLGASSIEEQADQPSNAALQEDVAGFGELSFLFPVLFLGAAAMATFVLLGRVVRSQQTQIATLRANGVTTGRIVRHYLVEAMLVTVPAGLVGLALGVVTGRLVTGVYTDAISVPDTVIGFHPGTVIAGVVLAVVTGAVAAAAPALAAARAEPGIALRGVPPPRRGGRSGVERLVPPLRRLPARWRMTLRGIGRNRRRSLTTGIGVVLALVLILTSWGMIDTVEILLDRQFQQVQRQDAQLYLDPSASDAAAAVAATPGVDRVEPVVQSSVVISHDGASYPTELVGFASGTEMHDFGATGPPRTGIVAGRSLGGLLDVSEGDTVTVRNADGSTEMTLPIDGFVDEPLGTLAYSDIDVARPFGDPVPSVLVRFAPGADADQMRARLTAVPGVVAYIDAKALYDTAQSLLSLFYAFVGVMLAFGAVMAFALLFNTTAVNAAERATELAAMKVNGASAGQLARLMAGENLLLTALAVVPGLLAGWGVAAVFMASFSSDLFDFSLHMRGRTLVLSALAILAVSAAAQWPTARTVDRLDVARVVRERSQ